MTRPTPSFRVLDRGRQTYVSHTSALAAFRDDGACEFTQQMLPALEKAVQHPDMTEELAEVLSTSVVDVEYHVETGVNVR